MNETTLTCSLDKQDEVHLFKERKTQQYTYHVLRGYYI